MSLMMLDDVRKLDLSRLERDFSFEEWMRLSDEEKRYIYKHVWNPSRPDCGVKTREEILARFRESLSIPEDDILKLHYSYFGACVGAIHIVLKNSIYKVPSHFAWLPVNRGVILGDRIIWRWIQ